MLKILSVGSSFSQDAHKWLKPVCDSVGIEIYNVNLYIAGCALDTHWENFVSNEENYDYEVAGVCTKKIALQDALRAEDWDVVLLQQASHLSGIEDSYMPYAASLAEKVREMCPKAKIFMHLTWAYEKNSDHPCFVYYNNDQREMFERTVKASEKTGKTIDAIVVPTGKVIQYLRDNGFEHCLTRDGYHLSLVYGRYAASLTWYALMVCTDLKSISFVPADNGEVADEATLQVVKEAVAAVLKEHGVECSV